MGTHADMSPLSKVVNKDKFKTEIRKLGHDEDDDDHKRAGQFLPRMFSSAETGPGEIFVRAEVEPQVGTGVKAGFGAGVVAGDGVTFGTSSNSTAADMTGQIREKGTGIEAGVEAISEARKTVGDITRAGAGKNRAGILPYPLPWSVNPRSKDRRYRSSHWLVLHYIIPNMNTFGMSILDNFLGSKIGDRILHEVQELHHAGKMQDGRLGSSGLKNTKSIRGDQIAWVEGNEPGCENIGYLLSRMDKLITCADGKLGKHKIRGRHKVVPALQEYGFYYVDGLLGELAGGAVLDQVKDMHASGVLQDGRLAGSVPAVHRRSIRGDKIAWVSGSERGCEAINFLLNLIDKLVSFCSGRLGNKAIRERSQAMVACYPGNGAGYIKHVDNPNCDGRCITCIYYLNKNWNAKEHGGILRIFPEGKSYIADIKPLFDRLLFFWSDRRNPHEVQPSYTTRYAITVWYFDSEERAEAKRRFRDLTASKAQQGSGSSSTS